MKLLQIILKRRSVRTYKDAEIPEEVLREILKAGLLAPTSRNLKPCGFYLVKDKETLRKLAEVKGGGAEMLKDAGAAIVVVCDSEKADTWLEDSAITLSYMDLAAAENGIGSCWSQIYLRKGKDGSDAEANVRKVLNLEEKWRIAAILSLGIPENEPAAHREDEADFTKVHII